MADEDSFVILGSSPLPSMRNEEISKSTNLSSFDLKQILNEEVANSTSATSSASENISLINATTKNTHNILSSSLQESSTTPATITSRNVPLNATNKNTDNILSLFSSTLQQRKGSKDETLLGQKSLAASFIMGEIDADTLKTSVYSQFPSMSLMEASAEDVIKLQKFMNEYIDLKNTLSKVNTTMKQFYGKTQQWREEMQAMEQDYKKQLQSCNLQIAMLRNENLELKRNIDKKSEEMMLYEDIRRKEHAEIVCELSEKTSQLSNMAKQIEKLEAQQLASFEYVSKQESDNKNDQTEYVARLEHERVVKQFECQISELLAENLDLKDMQKRYHDEIDCLKVNLTAAEELLNKSRADINLLMANDVEKTLLFKQYEANSEEMREEIKLLHHQVEVYSKDFEIERVARQNLAGEKDQLLQDLRILQRKNQNLIQEAQKQLENYERQKSSTPPRKTTVSTETQAYAFGNTTDTDNGSRCPICSNVFQSYSALTSHVNDCIDKNN